MGRTTLAVTLKPEAGRDGLHVVRIRITKDRIVRFWALSLALDPKHYNAEGKPDRANWVRKSQPEHNSYNERILAAYRTAEGIVAGFEQRRALFESTQVRDALTQEGASDRLLPYLVAHIDRRKREAGRDLSKLTTAQTYTDLLHLLRGYLRDALDLPKSFPAEGIDELSWPLPSLTKKDILDLRVWLTKYYKESSISSHLSKLRHLLNCAADEGLVSRDPFPMKGVTITTQRRQVQRLRQGDIDKLATAPAPKKHRGGHPAVTDPENARPLAMTLFLTHGARIGDAIQWRVRHYVVEGREHRLRYQTGKNKKWLSVLLDAEAVGYLAPYRLGDDGSPKTPDEFLFPYLPGGFDKLPTAEQYLELRRAKIRAKSQIKRLGERIGFEQNLTPHLMRHSFADMMRRAGVPLEVRQSVLGHSDVRTTRDYDDQFDQAESDAVTETLYQLRKNPLPDNSGLTNVKTNPAVAFHDVKEEG